MRPREEINALTGLRALAAAWVVLHHYRDLIGLWLPGVGAVEALAHAGTFGVDVFFVLSGFIITLTYADAFRTFSVAQYARYLWLRLARCYPVHLATLLALVPVVFIAHARGLQLNRTGIYTLRSFIESLLLVQAWGPSNYFPWNGVAWSISAEWFAYLTFPLLALVVARVQSTRGRLVGITLALAAGAFLQEHGGLSAISPFDHLNLLRIAGSFTAGAFTCALYRSGVDRQLPWRFITPLLAISVVIAAAGGPAIGLNMRWVVLLVPWLILGLAQGRDVVARWLSSPWMVFGGKVSFALYMTHALCKFALMAVIPLSRIESAGLGVRWGVAAFHVTFVVGTAVLTYRLIEEPARHWMRRLAERPAPAQVTPAA